VITSRAYKLSGHIDVDTVASEALPSSIYTYRITRTRTEITPYGLNNTAPSTHLTRPPVHIIHPSLITAIIPYLYWAAASRTSVCHNLGHTSKNPQLVYTSHENKSYVLYKRTRAQFLYHMIVVRICVVCALPNHLLSRNDRTTMAVR